MAVILRINGTSCPSAVDALAGAAPGRTPASGIEALLSCEGDELWVFAQPFPYDPAEDSAVRQVRLP